MDAATGFAAIALAAVASDRVCTVDEAKALRRELEYRHPYATMDEASMATLFDDLLRRVREDGCEQLVAEAAGSLNAEQRLTAFAVACNLIRSDHVVTAEEQAFVRNLALHLNLDEPTSKGILKVLDTLHCDVLQPH